MSRVVQKYYSVQELAWTYSFAECSIRSWMRAGEFGPQAEFLTIGQHVRVPTSGALFFESNHRKYHDEERTRAKVISGRTLGEARRHAMQSERLDNEGDRNGG